MMMAMLSVSNFDFGVIVIFVFGDNVDHIRFSCYCCCWWWCCSSLILILMLMMLFVIDFNIVNVVVVVVRSSGFLCCCCYCSDHRCNRTMWFDEDPSTVPAAETTPDTTTTKEKFASKVQLSSRNATICCTTFVSFSGCCCCLFVCMCCSGMVPVSLYQCICNQVFIRTWSTDWFRYSTWYHIRYENGEPSVSWMSRPCLFEFENRMSQSVESINILVLPQLGYVIPLSGVRKVMQVQ